MMNEVRRMGRERRVVQMPMRVLRQCLRFALYLFMISINTSSYAILLPLFDIYSEVQLIRSAVPDGVTGPQSDPLRDGPVLLLGSRELLLRAEGLMALFESIISFDP